MFENVYNMFFFLEHDLLDIGDVQNRVSSTIGLYALYDC